LGDCFKFTISGTLKDVVACNTAREGAGIFVRDEEGGEDTIGEGGVGIFSGSGVSWIWRRDVCVCASGRIGED